MMISNQYLATGLQLTRIIDCQSIVACCIRHLGRGSMLDGPMGSLMRHKKGFVVVCTLLHTDQFSRLAKTCAAL
jgi:hypothetical protein